MKGKLITGVLQGSAAEKQGIAAGDILLLINNKAVNDVFDYRFLSADKYIELIIKKGTENKLLTFYKDEYEDLGLSFELPMMDAAASCQNSCVFCFIDQLPTGMRKTLYFKDDDNRLSFLQGNYVTLTNMTEADLARIIAYKMSPVNISVHTINPGLRVAMLKNKNAAEINRQMKRLSDGGIEMNCQIVLVKGINTGDVLRETLNGLYGIKGVKSVSCVPAGLTKHRENLEPLEPFKPEDAIDAIGITGEIAAIALKDKGHNFAYASDELYIRAGMNLPRYKDYDDFPQLENGVGIIRLFECEFEEALNAAPPLNVCREITIITAEDAYAFICALTDRFMRLYPNVKIRILKVINKFFGETITVTGLLTGEDIIETLIKENANGRVLIPDNCFKADEDILLDDVTLDDITNRAGVIAEKVSVNGKVLVEKIFSE
jgi:putative radical SAM enzyme (TIGR03279 family)